MPKYLVTRWIDEPGMTPEEIIVDSLEEARALLGGVSDFIQLLDENGNLPPKEKYDGPTAPPKQPDYELITKRFKASFER